MDGRTFDQRLVGVGANGVVDFQLGWPPVSDFPWTRWGDAFLMKCAAGLPGV